ncbi:hypothetical protein ACWD3J_49305 [Streptomyces sp. NPDC002755]|uniref:hypothetical protein n=1 Tax=Streptomyces sp. NPDC002884 TaxID=3154544 RepID=UPI003326CBFE
MQKQPADRQWNAPTPYSASLAEQQRNQLKATIKDAAASNPFHSAPSATHSQLENTYPPKTAIGPEPAPGHSVTRSMDQYSRRLAELHWKQLTHPRSTSPQPNIEFVPHPMDQYSARLAELQRNQLKATIKDAAASNPFHSAPSATHSQLENTYPPKTTVGPEPAPGHSVTRRPHR